MLPIFFLFFFQLCFSAHLFKIKKDGFNVDRLSRVLLQNISIRRWRSAGPTHPPCPTIYSERIFLADWFAPLQKKPGQQVDQPFPFCVEYMFQDFGHFYGPSIT